MTTPILLTGARAVYFGRHPPRGLQRFRRVEAASLGQLGKRPRIQLDTVGAGFRNPGDLLGVGIHEQAGADPQPL